MKNGKYFLKIEKLGENISEIQSDLSVKLGDDSPKNYSFCFNDNGSISIELANGYISADRNGCCSVKD